MDYCSKSRTRDPVYFQTLSILENKTMDATTQTTLIAIEATGHLGETLCLSRHGL